MDARRAPASRLRRALDLRVLPPASPPLEVEPRPPTAKKRRMGTRRFHVTAPRKARAAFSERSPATRTLTTRALPEAREASRGRAGETMRLARAGAPRLRVCGGSAEAKEKLRHARESTTLSAEEFHVGRPEYEISISHQTERSDWRRAAHVRESRRRRRFHMSRSAGSAGPQRDARHV